MGEMIFNLAGEWFLGLVSQHPAFAGCLAIIGLLRVCVKPAMTLLQAYVKFTPYDQDDKWLSSVEASKAYKIILYLMDWILSVKGPKK